ncbi:hypothetical protein [Rhizobium sp. BK251]|uniref:hypothetical protein n=1 Tax=Rhizobium sp. BK251 TaxID=2512125 RepID=UPI001043B130|nr:hypothetical protein [Rhizobium sp. BK251]TCL72998.1 hypothetical protein EV286_104427 [Rhizobium sp. BK251]
MRMRHLIIGSVALAPMTLALSPALAQDMPKPTGCVDAGKAEPATDPVPGNTDSTAPHNAGTSGWTGGTGGAHIGTNPSGATAASTTWQPPTARGLDLTMAPESESDNPAPPSAAQQRC